MIEITRDKNDKTAIVRVGVSGSWSIYAGASADSIDMNQPIASDEGAGVFLLDVPTDRRTYFRFVSAKEQAIFAERLLPMTGGYNFRDLGGYKTEEGKTVKWGRIIRSDDLHELTKEDLTYLAQIPIETIVDFRAKEEIEQGADQLPSPTTKRYELSITPGSLNDTSAYINATAEEVDGMMIWMYQFFVTSDEAIAQYREFFRLLQDDEHMPLLFHCSAGKDRTGMGAALILFALGVPEATIMRDYMASNRYITGKYEKYIAMDPGLKPMFIVKPEFLQAGIDKIKSEYGSAERFLTDKLGVNIARFREMYLY